MRHAAALICIAMFAAVGLHGEGYGPSLTVLLDFQEAQAAAASLDMIEPEVQAILQPSGMRVQVRFSSKTRPHESFSNLVLFRFKGNCAMPSDPRLIDERGPGPLAFAHTSEGRVQPFGEVACDSVRRAVDSALWGGQYARRDEIFGRALGRVVAHELVHMIGNTGVHGKSGLFKKSLSASQLTADHLKLSPDDFELIRRSRQVTSR